MKLMSIIMMATIMKGMKVITMPEKLTSMKPKQMLTLMKATTMTLTKVMTTTTDTLMG
jgi:hypothetical protein